VYSPYIKQEEPLKAECQHFLDCIRNGAAPLSDGGKGLELVRILEASSESLKRGGSPVNLVSGLKGDKLVRSVAAKPVRLAAAKKSATRVVGQKYLPTADPNLRIKIQVNGHQENGHQA